MATKVRPRKTPKGQAIDLTVYFDYEKGGYFVGDFACRTKDAVAAQVIRLLEEAENAPADTRTTT